jgi:hypothetical protein
MTLSVLRLYSVNNRKINEYGAVDGNRNDRGKEVLGETLPQFYFVHQKSCMTWPGIQPRPVTTWALTPSTSLLLSVCTLHDIWGISEITTIFHRQAWGFQIE